MIDKIPTLDERERRSLGEAYISRTQVFRELNRPYFIDKMPGNFIFVGLINQILPNAKIIDARRHPLGCGWSCFTQRLHTRPGALPSDLGRNGQLLHAATWS